MHKVLVNCLGSLSLPMKSVVNLTDPSDMTIDVYRGRKTTTQQQQLYQSIFLNCYPFSLRVNYFQELHNLANPVARQRQKINVKVVVVVSGVYQYL